MQRQTFGKRINYLRKERGFTSEQLSEMCGVNAPHIRQIESGKRMPSLPLFLKICNALGTSADYLLGDSLEQPVMPEPVEQFAKQLKHLTPSQIEMINKVIEITLEYYSKEQPD